MKIPVWGSSIRTICRFLLAGVFAVSVVSKLAAPGAFKTFVETIPLVSQFDVDIVLLIVVLLEITLIVLLFMPFLSHVGGLLSFAVLLLFSAILLYMSHQEITVSCGCFGGIFGQEDLDQSFLRNVLLMLLSVPVFVRSERSETVAANGH